MWDPIEMATSRTRPSNKIPVSNNSHYSLEEIQKKRMKGLCFAYDEKLSPNHVCKNKNLKILMLEEVEPVKPGEMVVSKLTLLSMAALTSKSPSR